MPFIGNQPAKVPLTSADITDGIITSAKIADATIANADIASGAAIALTKLASTGTLTVDNIQFPATQVASSNANNLDDYEEGTWTPNIGGTATYLNQIGRYTKVGRMVSIQFIITINSRGTGSTSVISGLPFTCQQTFAASGHVGYFDSLAVNTIFLAFYIGDSGSTITMVGKATSGATIDNALAVFGTTAGVYGAATYFTT